MREAIGGYFGLELRKGEHYHRNALRLNTGRNCFEYILRARNYKYMWLPYYTCEVMLEPLNKLHISYSFYRINEQLEPQSLPDLKENEAFLYTNYYGLKQQTVERLASYYGNQLIIDNAQAFFAPRIEGIDTFYTARKFFGVPDGAYLYTEKLLDIELPKDESVNRFSHMIKRIENGAESGFADYQRHEDELCNQPIKRMSLLTENILKSIDYDDIKQKRVENYKVLQKALQNTNQLSFELKDAIPMVYPYLPYQGAETRHTLQRQRIYTATYWPNVESWNSPTWEQHLTKNMLPLPIDQRYDKYHLEIIKKCII